MTKLTVAKNYKDSIFRTIFSKEENLLELYEALSGQHRENAKIQIRTIKEVIYANWKNDIAFTIDDKVVVLIEHQSTISENLPLRMLSYVSKIYESLVNIRRHDLYQRLSIKLPTPEFYVFYNGKEPRPLKETLRLSGSYKAPTNDPQLELQVNVINVNYEAGAELLQQCSALNLYSQIVSLCRKYLEPEKDLEEAMKQVEAAFQTSETGRKFFAEYGLEGIRLLFDELTHEEYCEVMAEGARKEGQEEGRQQEAQTIAAKMKKEEIPVETIIKFTGLSQEEIKNL